MPSGSRDNSSLVFLPGNLAALLLLLYHSQLPPWQETASKRLGQDIPQSHQQGENPRSGSDSPSLGQVSAPGPSVGRSEHAAGLSLSGADPWDARCVGSLGEKQKARQVAERSRKPGRWLPLPSPSTTAEYGFPGANADSVTSEGLTAATYHIKKTLVSSSIEQTFIEHLLSARHCDRCHGKYKE